VPSSPPCAVITPPNPNPLSRRSALISTTKHIRVGNALCSITSYIPFGPQTQCYNCQQYGHPKEFCKADPVCGVCAGPHAMSKHECPIKLCKSGPVCINLYINCAACQGPHGAMDRNCPVGILSPFLIWHHKYH
jgi:hypothetical protein